MPGQKYHLDRGEQRVPVDDDLYAYTTVRNSIYRHARRRKRRVYTELVRENGATFLVYGALGLQALAEAQDRAERARARA